MKEMLWLVLAILIIFLVVLFMPTATNEDPHPSDKMASGQVTGQGENAQPEQEKAGPVEVDEETRYRLMKEEFARLEQDRRELKRRLGKLKYYLRDIELGAEQAKGVNESMRNGYKLLHTRKMLGAFYSLAEISEERARISYTNANLDEVDHILKENTPGESATVEDSE